VLRIHASQKLTPVDGNPRHYRFTVYAPQLSLAPTPNVRLGVTVVFPLDHNATVAGPVVESLPNQAPVNTDVFTDTTVGQRRAFCWAFHADPKIIIGYTYP